MCSRLFKAILFLTKGSQKLPTNLIRELCSLYFTRINKIESTLPTSLLTAFKISSQFTTIQSDTQKWSLVENYQLPALSSVNSSEMTVHHEIRDCVTVPVRIGLSPAEDNCRTFEDLASLFSGETTLPKPTLLSLSAMFSAGELLLFSHSRVLCN